MLWGQRVGALQRGALEGDEEVDRDRIGIDGFERFNRFDDLVVRLTQAEDESRTRREPGAASLVDGVDTVGESMGRARSEEHTSELQSRFEIVCRRLLEKKNRRFMIRISYNKQNW